ncbi:MAG: FHA domain-containing protein, partial [Blastocatellia bacterium]|nr:FHA domain-containing protein [Blastocatellia bacterium]
VAPSQKNVTAIGTMGYAPPELFAGKVEPRSDLYSLGATMFHLLTGKDPQDNPLLMFDFTRNPRMCEINTELSKGIDEIVSKAVEHKPSSRFSSGDEMKKALEDHLLWLERGVISSSAPAQVSKGIFCSACGHSMGVGDRFCNNCGAPNPEFASQQVSVVLAGANGQLITLPLTKESSMFGRLDTNRGIYPDVDLTPYDREGKVSRRHAMIHQEKGQFFIEDLGSTNGTYINNTKIPAKQRQKISTGEELRFGDIIMKFFIGPVPPSVVIPTRIATGGVVNQSSVKHTIEGSAVGIAGIALAGSSKAPAPRTTDSQQKNELVSTKVEFPSRVKIGEITPLRISLRALPLGTKVEKNLDHDVEFEVSLDKLGASGKSGSSRTLDAYIAAPGFEIEPEIFAKLTVPVTGFSIPSVFYLKGIQTGSTIVTIDFYQDATCVCSVNVKTEIV